MDWKKTLAENQKNEVEFNAKQQSKVGDYTEDKCPNCGRMRVMLGDDNCRRCEKCYWCIEMCFYDPDFARYMDGL